MRRQVARTARARLWLGMAVTGWMLLTPACRGVIRQIHSIKDWRPAFRPFDTMRLFTELDFQRAGVGRVEGFNFAGSVGRDFGNPDAPISGGAGFGVFETEPTRFWLMENLAWPWRYGVAVSVFDDNYYDDDPVEAVLRLYGVADRVLGEVSVTVPPANSMAEVTAGARFLAAVSSDAIRSWEFRISGNNHAAFDDMLITWVAIPVPEPSSLMLALAAATLGGLGIARRVRGPA